VKLPSRLAADCRRGAAEHGARVGIEEVEARRLDGVIAY